LKFLQEALKIKRKLNGRIIDRKIKEDDLARIYYELAKIYEHKNKKNRYKDAVRRCQRLKNTKSYYKKMCDKM